MKELTLTIVVTSLVVISLISPVRAEIVTMDEALTVANNWITVLLQKKGTWGDANTAHVEDVQEFQRDGRILGYFCRVWPKGYIIISLRKELAPVKACSATSDLDPASEEGMVDLIKDCMERILNTIEKEVGPLHSARTEDISKILEIDYRTAWAELGRDEETFEKGLGLGVITMNYQEGGVLLDTRWSQGDPYNRDCPPPPSGDDCDRPRCSVGCVATAAAQIMRYWYWPPYGVGSGYDDPYDWVNMPDDVTGTSPAAQINAVAELCHEIGVAVDMDYCDGDGCASAVSTEDMEDVYEGPYRYSDSCYRLNRVVYTPEEWFNEVKIQINSNQPIQYRVVDHSIVADGWRVLGVLQYHMNYGWDDEYTTWYTLDALHKGDFFEEYMMVNIFPVTSVRHAIVGVYPRGDFNFRYFNQDASGSSAIFESGQNFQFLPKIVVTSSGNIEFGGNSRFFTRGDMSRGIRTDIGGISMYSGGQMKLY
ncbi:MAG: hypothetical protein AMJ75_03350 [Phycisphaerae bacterium SM1_79]|nr:MAG: hypothetical protein AMJ75_03350 [Phycisphaerae bacterium SM1_79]